MENQKCLLTDIQLNDVTNMRSQTDLPPSVKKIMRSHTPITKEPCDIPLFVLDAPANDNKINCGVNVVSK